MRLSIKQAGIGVQQLDESCSAIWYSHVLFDESSSDSHLYMHVRFDALCIKCCATCCNPVHALSNRSVFAT